METAERLKVEYLPIDSITPYENNARTHKDKDVEAIKKSIETFGMVDPIGIWGTSNIIIEGHGRLMALQQLGYDRVPCIRLDDLTDEQRRGYTLSHNRTAELSSWDDSMLKIELKDLSTSSINMSDFGFDTTKSYDDLKDTTLAERFIAPPFTVIDRTQGYWKDRVEEWKGKGIDSTNADPVLFELLCKWFCTDNGRVGYSGNNWKTYEGVSKEIGNKVVATEDCNSDMILIEAFYDGEGYEIFLSKYKEIVREAICNLKDNRFIICVVRNARSNGMYYDLNDDFKGIFKESSIGLYNELILVSPIEDEVYIDGEFRYRMMHDVHSNILVFYKGSIRAIKENFKPIGEGEA